ncbi:hypothetical protein B0T25DRAFT_1656 [Lasiosphaeria hispida]|uniref:Uncharacterized protein n=1 Tax=Lasiosphaeria hispida TaxID=260671 RepID=A0AAJ0HTC9_9PEZI|nr:hypothetical protein B0T25DRAFT_1656 [Lasiosphaeria hispida]
MAQPQTSPQVAPIDPEVRIKYPRGALLAEPSRPSISKLPFEMQTAIFKAASGPQIFFTEITLSGGVEVSRSAFAGLALTCRLARYIFTRYRTLYRLCGVDNHTVWRWVDSAHDIYYVTRDRLQRALLSRQPVLVHERFTRVMMLNIAADLSFMGEHPRRDAMTRLWNVFPAMRQIHVLVPRGPLRTPVPQWTAETMVLGDLPREQIIAPPGQDPEMWWAVMYQLKRTCGRILETENGFAGRVTPEICGRTAEMRIIPEIPVPTAEKRTLTGPPAMMDAVGTMDDIAASDTSDEVMVDDDNGAATLLMMMLSQAAKSEGQGSV